MRGEKKIGKIRIRLQQATCSSNMQDTLLTPPKNGTLEDMAHSYGFESVSSSTPPIWFLNYMSQFKDELKEEVSTEVIAKVSEILLKNADIFKDNRSKAKSSSASKARSKSSDDDHEALDIDSSSKIPHPGITCDHCEKEIYGVRYKCSICLDFDLCETCDQIPKAHDKSHNFLRIREPVKTYGDVWLARLNNALTPLTHRRYCRTGLHTRSVSPNRKSFYGSGGYLAARNPTYFPSPILCRRSNHGNVNNPSGGIVTSTNPRNKRDLKSVKIIKKVGLPRSIISLGSPSYSTKHRESISKDTSKELNLINENRLLSKRFYDFVLVQNDSVPDGTLVVPGAQFTKLWRVRNTGIKPWTEDTVLKYSWGNLIWMNSKTEELVPPLVPGQECTLGVQFLAPLMHGSYQSNWRLSCQGVSFGHRLSCNIIVVSSAEDKLVEKENVLEKEKTLCSSVPSPLKATCIAQVLSEVHIDQENGQVTERRCPVNSSTATPSNTPFDTTPSKSPELGSPPAADFDDYDLLDTDETASILSISSCDSDYVKIPIPETDSFHLNSPFSTSTNNLPNTSYDQLASYLNATAISSSKSDSSSASFVHVVNDSLESPREKFHLCPSSSSLEEGRAEAKEKEQPTEEMTTTSIISGETGVPEETSLIACGPIVQQPVGLSQTEHKSLEEPTASFDKTKLDPKTNGIPIHPLHFENGDTVQVLPEALVTGALTAAASVYNTARAIFSNIQSQQEGPPLNTGVRSSVYPQLPVLSPMGQLMEMGFSNRQLNSSLLVKHENDVNAVVAELLQVTDNNWNTNRHSQIEFD